jgi:cytochrome b561
MTVRLHWIVAIFMIGLLGTGIYMEGGNSYALYPWHKSFGVLIALFVAWRVYWRVKNGWPSPVRQYASHEAVLAKLAHYLLIIGTVLMPISGFMMSALGGHGVDFFGLELVARNPDPADPSKVIPLHGPIAGSAHSVHGIAGYVIVVALVLHIVGALKHHTIDKDGTLRRMLGAEV